MKHQKSKLMLWSTLIVYLMGGFLFVMSPALVQAGSTLPPRDRPTLDPPYRDDSYHNDDHLLGAHIELQVLSAGAGLWTVVQWQDSAGNWHDVEGWQGWLEGQAGQRWWAAARDFGKGPFRWVIKQGPDGPIVNTSDSFSLPTGANETIQIVIP